MVQNNAVARYIEELASRAGFPFVQSLLKNGRFVVVAGQADLPPHLAADGRVCSIFDPAGEITWFVAENLVGASVYGNMLREIGIHFGLGPMLGDKRLREVLADARRLAGVGDPAMLAAWRLFAGGAKSYIVASDDEIQQAIGYLVEDPRNHTMGITRKTLSSLKVFLFKKGFPVGRLSPADLSILAASAAREAVLVPRDHAAIDGESPIAGGTRYTGPDRRKSCDRRKALDEMTREELRREILTDALTGLGNRRAMDETEERYRAAGMAKVKVFIDVDSLKFVNDHLGGHEAGDKLLRVIATALGDAAGEAFRLGGDEFCFFADGEEDAERIAGQVINALQQVVIRYEVDGRIFEYKNPGFSYGIGKDLETADRNMLEHKKNRERAGLRAERSRPPPGLAEIPSPGREDHDRNHGPTREYGPPSVRDYLKTFTVNSVAPDDDNESSPPSPSPQG